jgi:hypothetical protein
VSRSWNAGGVPSEGSCRAGALLAANDAGNCR